MFQKLRTMSTRSCVSRSSMVVIVRNLFNNPSSDTIEQNWYECLLNLNLPQSSKINQAVLEDFGGFGIESPATITLHGAWSPLKVKVWRTCHWFYAQWLIWEDWGSFSAGSYGGLGHYMFIRFWQDGLLMFTLGISMLAQHWCWL